MNTSTSKTHRALHIYITVTLSVSMIEELWFSKTLLVLRMCLFLLNKLSISTKVAFPVHANDMKKHDAIMRLGDDQIKESKEIG